jgi:Domain of unknown function (DUF1707)
VDRRSGLRASDADREQVIDRLHRAATEGRIAAEELEERVSTALKARTYRELEATVADLPRPARPRARTSAPGRSVGRWAFATVRANPILGLLLLPVFAATLALVFAITVLGTVLVAVAVLLGGRPGYAPWACGSRHRLHARHRRPGSSWV